MCTTLHCLPVLFPVLYAFHRNDILYPLLRSLVTDRKALPSIDEAANERMDILMPQLMKAAGVTEELKATDQMKWVGPANACRAQTEEGVLNQLVYGD